MTKKLILRQSIIWNVNLGPCQVVLIESKTSNELD